MIRHRVHSIEESRGSLQTTIFQTLRTWVLIQRHIGRDSRFLFKILFSVALAQ